MEPHQETSGALASSTEGRRISPTGAHRGMVQKKSESKKPGDNSIFEKFEHENNFEVEKVGRKIL